MTNDLLGRVYQHKNKQQEGFTRKYNVNQLVYYEESTDVNAAIAGEKQIKKWNRNWKLRIIEEFNPDWRDLYFDLMSGYSYWAEWEKSLPEAGFPPTRE